MRAIAVVGLALLIAATIYSFAVALRKGSVALSSDRQVPGEIGRNTLIAIVICTALAIAVLVGLAIITRTPHHIRVQKQMKWQCAPDQNLPRAPEVQPVRMRYVEDPHYEEVVSGRGLCDQLQRSGKEVVMVEFDAWGDSSRGLIGYREVAIDGNPIVDIGGSASSGVHDMVGPHPLNKLFR